MKIKAITKSSPTRNNPGNSEPALDELSELRLQRILVPVDFSESSRRALNYAVYFARRFGAELFLLHVLEPIPPPAPEFTVGAGLSGDTAFYDLAAAELAKWRDQIEPLVVVRSSVEAGTAHREIIRLAVENNIDLIVIGMRGHSGLAHFLFGSTAEQVVRHAICPVTVVRDAQMPARADTMERRAEAPLELASPVAAAY